MKLKVLLWGLGFLLKRNFKKFEKFKAMLEKEELDFSIDVKNTSIGRKFLLNKDGVTSSNDLSQEAKLRIRFNDPKEAYGILTSKQKDAFMRGIQDKMISVEGDFSKIMQLQKVMSKIKI